MSDRDKHIQLLFTAELQFRLASAVHLATTLKAQPLDLPIEWTHGQYCVRYEEIALRQDQADHAADFLQLRDFTNGSSYKGRNSRGRARPKDIHRFSRTRRLSDRTTNSQRVRTRSFLSNMVD